eukprot:jgi/Mesvir1/15368/Mv06566-RA.1
MLGGVGKARNREPGSTLVEGQNTIFSLQFRGRASSTNPFSLRVAVGGVAYELEVKAVYSDELMELMLPPPVDFLVFQSFTLGTPRGTGGLQFGPPSSEVLLEPSASLEQRTVVCAAGNDLPNTPAPTASCKFAKELRPGYLLVVDSVYPPVVRTVTEIISDTEMVVNRDFAEGDFFDVDTPLPHSDGPLAPEGGWTYIPAPPRVGKRAGGVGVIESHWDQISDAKGSGAIDDGNIDRMSGSGTLRQHRIVGRGTRFEGQFGYQLSWAGTGSGGYYGLGPWVSVKIGNDWETQKVVRLGSSGSYAEYIMVLENSFSEPLLRQTPFEWHTMLMPGLGRIRSIGKRVIAEEWATGSATGAYGNTRFLSQLRTGFTITAAGQTRTVNAIASDVELSIDRPFTNGNREFLPTANSTAKASHLLVRGLSRGLPLWPRGVTVEVIVTSETYPPKFKYRLWWKSFCHTDDGDGNSDDDSCTDDDVAGGSIDCGIVMQWDEWVELRDTELEEGIGVFVKWDKCAMGACNDSAVAFSRLDSWKLHVGDVQDVEFWISPENERFVHDDNLNPPLAYNYGRCLAISDGASTDEEASRRPVHVGKGLVWYDVDTFTLTSSPDPSDGSADATFLSSVTAGEVLRLLVGGASGDPANWIDIRVARVVSDHVIISDFGTGDIGSAASPVNYRVLRCPAGRRGGADHLDADNPVADESTLAYLPHPQLTSYVTWSYKFCEVDPGCCGFKVSSRVDPDQFAFYKVKPDHANYNYRVAVFTFNDNLDLYTRREDDGTGRPDKLNYASTSVRESVPWAIDEDESGMGCIANSSLVAAALGGGYTFADDGDAYSSTLGRYVQVDGVADCHGWVTGVMGDNRYPMTTGASEYHAFMALEFNFADFACEHSSLPPEDRGGFPMLSRRAKCQQSGLRLVRDADIVLNDDASPRWVARLTEAKQRSGGSFVKWGSGAGGRVYPNAQRSGALWWGRKLHIQDGFDSEFEFQVSSPSQCGGDDQICDGADGFAFVISNDDRQEDGDFRCSDADGTSGCDDDDGMIGCPAAGLGYANARKPNTEDFFGNYEECTSGLRRSLAVEFDLFYNVDKRDPKQGLQRWWINATEYVSYNDNHVGVFASTTPRYAHQPWGGAQDELRARHQDDDVGAHFGSTPSVTTMADFKVHTVRIRYTRGFTTEKRGSGKIVTEDSSSGTGDRRLLRGNAATRFRSELRAGFEFGYGNRVKADVKVKLFRDASGVDPETGELREGRFWPSGNGTSGLFGDDGEAVRVVRVLSDSEAYLEDTDIASVAPAVAEVKETYMPAFDPAQAYEMEYNIIKQYPGEIHVFIDDMDRPAFQVAVEDRDMAKILDTDGNAFLGLTAATGSKGFAKTGYNAEEVHQTHDILSWKFCNNPGCVPY